MEEIMKLSDDAIEQIKDFDQFKLTEEQKSLIYKLILDEELKRYYKHHGLCKECKQLKIDIGWCRICVFQ